MSYRTGNVEIDVSSTGHTVRSSWEKEIDEMLNDMSVEYEYEPIRFELKRDYTYLPDFSVDSYHIIEVKGVSRQRESIKAKRFMEQYPEYNYIVVGDYMPADVYLRWSDRNKLQEIIENDS